MEKVIAVGRRLKNKVVRARMTEGLIYRWALYLILISVSYVFLYPLLRMVLMTFMTRGDIINPEVLWVPTRITFNNLKVAGHVMNLPGSFWSTLWFTTILALGQTIVTSLSGYALARFNFRFKKMWS